MYLFHQPAAKPVGKSPGQGDTALHGAAREGHVAVVEKLISEKAKVDASGFQGPDLGKGLKLLGGLK